MAKLKEQEPIEFEEPRKRRSPRRSRSTGANEDMFKVVIDTTLLVSRFLKRVDGGVSDDFLRFARQGVQKEHGNRRSKYLATSDTRGPWRPTEIKDAGRRRSI